MKELLFGWIQDIAFYTLLMVVVLHVLPEKNQRKYLQFFMGIVLMILVISPFLTALGLEQQLDETYARQTYDRELQEFLRKQEAIEEEYQRHLEEKLYEARDEAESLKEEQREEKQQEEQQEQEQQIQESWIKEQDQQSQEKGKAPREGEIGEIPEIHIEIGKPEGD